MYLAPTRVSFSIWSSFLALQGIALAFAAGAQREVPLNAWVDQHVGAAIVWAVFILWLGRAHWLAVARQFVRRPPPEADQRLPAVAAIVGLCVMFGWLSVVGVGVPVMLLIVGFILLTHLTVARIVAESGLPFFRSSATPMQVLSLVDATSITSKEVLLTGFGNSFGAYTTRESVATFAQQGQQLADRTIGRGIAGGASFLALLAWSLGVALLFGSFASISAYYRFDAPLVVSGDTQVINKHGLIDHPKSAWIDPVVQHHRGAFAERKPAPLMQFLIGGAVVAGLQLLTLRIAAWPLVPIGFIVATSPFGGWIWFSALAGWLAKSIIVRFGGATLMTSLRPMFIGMIVGSVLAVGFWTIVNLVLLAMNLPYQPIRFLPT
jgi:hypothetical protein